MGNRWGNSGHSVRLNFGGAPKSLQMVIAAMKLKTLTPWKENYDNLDNILKSRDITLPTKVCLVKAMVFPGVMYGCESWTVKKAEHRRIDAVELWCWRRLLRVPWTARRSNQSFLKEISPGCSLEGMTVLWPPHAKSWLIGKHSDTGRDWGQEEKGTTEDEMVGWHRWLNGCEFEWTPGVHWTGRPGMLRFMGSQRAGHDWATELNGTEGHTARMGQSQDLEQVEW